MFKAMNPSRYKINHQFTSKFWGKMFEGRFALGMKNLLILVPLNPMNSTLFSLFYPSCLLEIGHQQSRPINECSIKTGRVLGSKIGRNLMIGERENAKQRTDREPHFVLQHFAR